MEDYDIKGNRSKDDCWSENLANVHMVPLACFIWLCYHYSYQSSLVVVLFVCCFVFFVVQQCWFADNCWLVTYLILLPSTCRPCS